MLEDPLLLLVVAVLLALHVIALGALLIKPKRRFALDAREERTRPMNWVRAALAEALGTFTLVFVGVLSITGARTAGGTEGAANLATVGLAYGLAVAVMVAALGATSGGHFNPAVTFGFVLTARMHPLAGLTYWTAQLGGAAAAGGLIVRLFGPAAVAGGAPALGPEVSPAVGVAVEAVTTFFLVLVVFGTAVDERAPRGIYPLAIGFTVALGVLATGPLTGAAMNPARSFGPSLAAWHWLNFPVYCIGPLLGGGLAALVQHYVLLPAVPAAKPSAGRRTDRAGQFAA
jgi:aquaporin Z